MNNKTANTTIQTIPMELNNTTYRLAMYFRKNKWSMNRIYKYCIKRHIDTDVICDIIRITRYKHSYIYSRNMRIYTKQTLDKIINEIKDKIKTINFEFVGESGHPQDN